MRLAFAALHLVMDRAPFEARRAAADAALAERQSVLVRRYYQHGIPFDGGAAGVR